jgi:hypothetical protein
MWSNSGDLGMALKSDDHAALAINQFQFDRNCSFGPNGPLSEEPIIRLNLRRGIRGKVELNADLVASGPSNNTIQKTEFIAAYGDFISWADADV